MNDVTQRLTKCFRAVFPELTDAQIESADMKNTPRWDSVNHIMLITVIDEEFGVDLDLEDLDLISSFRGLRNCLTFAGVMD